MAHCTQCGSRLPTEGGKCPRCGYSERQRGGGGAASILVGRGAHCDVVLDFSTVSNEHCRLRPVQGGYEVEDLGSTNGTHLRPGGARISDKTVVPADSALYLGSYRFGLAALASKGRDGRKEQLSRGGTGKVDSIVLTKSRMIIGRDPTCDVHVDHPRVSWHHAQLEASGQRYTITDLGSSNGTFLNGRRVKSGALAVGDIISLGSYSFTFSADKSLQKRRIEGDVTLSAEGLWVTVPDPAADGGRKVILEDVSFTVYPGELVGIMGPSGCGKTTMLFALLGIMEPAQGRACVNGRDIREHAHELRNIIGYVPQDDIMHPELTVREVLTYAARLRLPADTSEAEIDGRVQQTLQRVNLLGAAEVQVGSPDKKGISGGQKKRLNIALELLTEPSLLFLDEPTSGLSSEDALSLIKDLRALADRGKTVVLTIHQPGFRVYSALDNVLVLTGKTRADTEAGVKAPLPGRLAYYGPAVANSGAAGHLSPDSITFFNPGLEQLPPEERAELLKDPEAPLAGLETRPSGHWVATYRSHPLFREYVAERAGRSEPPGAVRSLGRPPGPNPLSQWWILTSRYARTKLGDLPATLGLLAQAPVIGALLAVVFDKKDPYDIPVFLLVVVAIWFGCINSVTELVKERAIFRRERMVFLELGPYLMSKVAVLGVLSLIQSGILLAILSSALALKAPWLLMLAIMFVCAMGGLAMGFLLSAIRPTLGSAMSILPIVLTAQIVLGGAMQPLPDMDVLPKALRVPQWAAQLTLSRWGFEGMLSAEERQRRKGWKREECPPVSCDRTPIVPEMPEMPPPMPAPLPGGGPEGGGDGLPAGNAGPVVGGGGPQGDADAVSGSGAGVGAWPAGAAQYNANRSEGTTSGGGAAGTGRAGGKPDSSKCMPLSQVPVCCLFQDFQTIGKSGEKGVTWKSCDGESRFESWDEVPLTDGAKNLGMLLVLVALYFATVFAALKWKSK